MLKLIKTLLVLGLLLGLAAGGWFYWRVSSPLVLPSESVDFQIPEGVGMRAAAREVAKAGVPVDPWMLIALGKLLRVESSIKAGSYEVSRGVTPLDLLAKLTRGDVTQTEISFIEGWTFRQMRDRLDAHRGQRL